MDVDDVDVEVPVVGGGRKEGKPKLDRCEGAREKERYRERQKRKPEGVTANEKDREEEAERQRQKARGTRSLRGSKLWIGLRRPRVRVNGWRPGDSRGGRRGVAENRESVG